MAAPDQPQVCLMLDPEQVDFTGYFLSEGGHSRVSTFHHRVDPPFGNSFSPQPLSSPAAAAHSHGYLLALSVVLRDLCLCGHLPLCVLGAPCYEGVGNRSGGSRGSWGWRGDVINYRLS